MDKALVSAAWLQKNITYPIDVILDATFCLSGATDARALYAAGHLPNARFFDIAAISDISNPLPHMLPPARQFSYTLGSLGIAGDSRIFVYDQTGLGAARAWWMCRAFGLHNVYVLNGGITAWQAAGGTVTTDVPDSMTTSPPSCTLQPAWLADKTTVAAASTNGHPLIIDVRSAERFNGHTPEPRPGMRAGHIPGSINLPYKTLLDASGHYLPNTILQQIFSKIGVQPQDPLIFTCGSGISACIGALAAQQAGFTQTAVYDGSWAEWGQAA